MKKKIKKLYLQQKKRYLKKIKGTFEKPRLCVFRSHKHIYAQLIDDNRSHTLVSSSSLNRKLFQEFDKTNNQSAAFIVGKDLAIKAFKHEITSVAFDRGNRPYHGRIKNVAIGARNAGLCF
jgi:large subunit ribosomal protein L18